VDKGSSEAGALTIRFLEEYVHENNTPGLYLSGNYVLFIGIRCLANRNTLFLPPKWNGNSFMLIKDGEEDCMKLSKILFIILAAILVLSSAAIVPAADFDWMKNFNVRAEADLSDFKARLTARFKIAGVRVEAVLSNCKTPADAYVACALGQMAGKPPEYVAERYRSGKDKGWGALAKSLEIKPGSKEFHALKNGSDFYDDNGKDKGKGKSKGKGKGKR
jgi:hypothetical protein